MKEIRLPFKPKKSIPSGLLMLSKKEGETDIKLSFLNVMKGVVNYPLPPDKDKREIKGIYVKVL